MTDMFEWNEKDDLMMDETCWDEICEDFLDEFNQSDLLEIGELDSNSQQINNISDCTTTDCHSSDCRSSDCHSSEGEESPFESQKSSYATESDSSNKSESSDHDIQAYAKLVEHAINTHELGEVLEALEYCCNPDMTLLVHYPKGNPYGYAYRQMTGRDLCANYLQVQFACAPDGLFLGHSSEVALTERGDKVLKIKYTCNGTRLYTLTEQSHGSILPNPPTIVRMHKEMAKVCNKTAPCCADERYCPKSNNVTLKKNENVSKFDRYHSHRGETLGAHVEYQNFSESSMQSRKKKLGDDGGDFVESYDQGLISRADCKGNCCPCSASLVAGRVAKLSGKYADKDKLIADSDTKYGFSALLPISVPLDVFGVMKFYFSGDARKACLMEMMIHARKCTVCGLDCTDCR